MKIEQMDLFDSFEQQPTKFVGKPVLNGMYYERSTGLFVSFVRGRRHFEVTPGRCLGDKDWKEKTMRERAI
ncbi:hypothetical protein [Paenibacillus azoreducens]|uniref:Uncharacterized protein n=1 Tax=Paenibacillus azoreducens TaxID=116718 RepID=A0A920CT44_9BACL|nr:hypothetical protein [Paenibacillus azoreducens]GIO48012.1 hypothetical protein J34TS1_27770 [Paenibacillus azoreducens]